MLKGRKIFIVEDDTMNRMVYTVILNKAQALYDFDRWGRHTLDQLNHQHWDLIILDLMLPNGESGFDIFESIRAIPTYDKVPIIAVSSSEPAVAIPRAKALGFDGYIAKPIDRERFPQQLAQILVGEAVWDVGNPLSQR